MVERVQLKDLPSQERLIALLAYDPLSGVLKWRSRHHNITFNKRFAGKVAGCVDKRGYRFVGVDGVLYMAHRLVWVYCHSQIPDGLLIDHVNGRKDDNRIDNLRLATTKENTHNSGVRSDNMSGFTSVYYQHDAKLWCGAFKHRGKNVHVGYYKNAVDAYEAVCRKKEVLQGEFASHVSRDLSA